MILSGKTGFVLQNGIARAFAKWAFPIHTKAVPVPNFQGQGFEQFVPGLTGAVITISGPYDSGAMPITSGTTYTFVLGWRVGLALTCVGFVTSLEPDDDVENAPMLKLTVQQTGPFAASVT